MSVFFISEGVGDLMKIQMPEFALKKYYTILYYLQLQSQKKLIKVVFKKYKEEYSNIEKKTEEEMNQIAVSLIKECSSNGLVCKCYPSFEKQWSQIIEHHNLRKKDCTLPVLIALLTRCQREHYWSYDYKTYIQRTKDGTIPFLVLNILNKVGI